MILTQGGQPVGVMIEFDNQVDYHVENVKSNNMNIHFYLKWTYQTSDLILIQIGHINIKF